MPVLPIVTYNDPILTKKAEPVDIEYEHLDQLITDMFETMYNSNGVGLAAPQIGKSIRLFVIDADEITKELDEPDFGPIAFINPLILNTTGDLVKMEEGCLSIPDVRDDVSRNETVTVEFLNRDLKTKKLTVSGWVSRIIQHEHDHLEGILFLNYLSAFRRRLHKSTLKKIKQGTLETDYPVVAKSEAVKG